MSAQPATKKISSLRTFVCIDAKEIPMVATNSSRRLSIKPKKTNSSSVMNVNYQQTTNTPSKNIFATRSNVQYALMMCIILR